MEAVQVPVDLLHWVLAILRSSEVTKGYAVQAERRPSRSEQRCNAAHRELAFCSVVAKINAPFSELSRRS
jgi:hypothetical protein